MSEPWHRDVPRRVTEYLANGGLFNPEFMDHEAVRHILIDARDVIEIIARDAPDLETRALPHEAGWCPRCGCGKNDPDGSVVFAHLPTCPALNRNPKP